MIRIALLDGPLDIGNTDDPTTLSPATQHARAVAAAIRSLCSEVEILEYPIFTERLTTTREQVAQAVADALAVGGDLLHCSFGFSSPDAVTTALFRQACQQFSFVVASSPARGAATYPAAYSGVIKASGDARCHSGNYAWLSTANVDFAASPLPVNKESTVGGASIAAGRVSGIIASAWLAGASDQLVTQAAFHGAERKGG